MPVWRFKPRDPDLTYVSPDVELGKAMRESWEQKVLLDFTIKVENQKFKVHKVVMASVSDYFKAMLMGGMVESQADSVKLEGLKSLAVSNIIEYIYTNRITKSRASPEDLLACAVYLQIPKAIKAASDMLQKKLDKRNCFDVMATFQTYSLKGAVETTKQYLKTNMAEILAHHKLESLSFEHFMILVKMWSKAEWDLFHLINDWVTADYENRKQHIDSLTGYGCMNFTLIPPAELDTIKQMNIYSEEVLKERVHGALEHHTAPVYSKLRLDLNAVREQFGDPSPVCFPLKSSTTMHVLGKNKNWRPVTVPATPDFSDGVDVVMEHRGFIIVVENYSANQKIHVFDSTMMKWSTIASILTPRSDFALVCDEEYFYALGGRINVGTDDESITDTIESYHIENNTWTVKPTTMPLPSFRHSACLGWGQYSSIYVLGGCLTLDEDSCSTRFDCFDPDKTPHTWERKAPMLEASICQVMRCMEFNGKDDVIFVMYGDFKIQYYDMETDQWNLWNAHEAIYSSMIGHWNGTVLKHPMEHTFYLLNFVRDHRIIDEGMEFGACAKWDVDHETLNISEVDQSEFPIEADDWGLDAEQNYIVAMITMPKPAEKKLVPAVKRPVPVVQKPAPAKRGRGPSIRRSTRKSASRT